MSLRHSADIELPVHAGRGGFDHAAVHRGRGRLYVAHTANDALDVIDTSSGRYVRSIPDLKGVAGALVDEAQDLVFTSNRGENTIGIFSPEAEDSVVKVTVGIRPNGLAFDPEHGILLSANVGDPDVPNSPSVTLVDVRARHPLCAIPMPGRTRWAVFDPGQRLFFVNIADPPRIVAVEPKAPGRIVRHVEIPARGPHGLEVDLSRQHLLCACDDGTLVSVHASSGEILATLALSGPPDVVFLNQAIAHLYVAIGDPGVIDVIDTRGWKVIERVATERGAHTIAHDETARKVYAFLPETHRAQVFEGGV